MFNHQKMCITRPHETLFVLKDLQKVPHSKMNQKDTYKNLNRVKASNKNFKRLCGQLLRYILNKKKCCRRCI